MDNLEKSYFSSNIDITVENIHSIIYHHMDKAWSYNPSEENFLYRFIYVCEGDFYAYINNQKILVRKGDILYIPEKFAYRSKSITPFFSYVSIFFWCSKKSVPQDSFFSNWQLVNHCEKYRKEFESIYNIYVSKSFAYMLSCKNLLYDIMKNTITEKMLRDEAFSGYYTIKKAVTYIENNYMKNNITVNFLANLCNLTPTYFINVFKKIFLTTPKNYIIAIRIQRAKEMLVFSNYTIVEIANNVGYSDPAYFSAAFKAQTGFSPMQYRKNHF